MNLLVTGGGSYLSSGFCKMNSKNFRLTYIKDDESLLDSKVVAQYFKDKNFDAVIHAADGMNDTEHLLMFKNVQYESVATGVKKLILVTNQSDLGRPIDGQFTEDDFGTFVPHDMEGFKHYVVTAQSRQDNITSVFRLFNAYGIGKRTIVSDYVADALTGKESIDIERNKIFSTVFSEDFFDIIAGYIEGDYGKGEYNIAGETEMSLLEAARTVQKLLRADGGDIDIRLSSDDLELGFSGSNDKIQRLMPHIKFTSPQSAIKKIYSYYKRYPARIRTRV